jgi:hypothetical protein
MKRTIGVLFTGAITILLLSFAINPIATEPTGPKLTFSKPLHDFGTVYTDSLPDTKVDIEFKNTGDAPLLISGVRACCGTRVNEWPKEPILPGDTGMVKVNFRLAPSPQRISRTVTITYNKPDQPSVVYRIVGNVVSR